MVQFLVMAITDKEFYELKAQVTLTNERLLTLTKRFDERSKVTRTLITIVFAQLMATAGGFLLLVIGKG
jgi:hypothetical protein